MQYTLIQGPAAEPVSLAEVRQFLRLDDSGEDALLAALIASARETCERFTGRSLITQSWRLMALPRSQAIDLSRGPVAAILAVRRMDAAPPALIDASVYCLERSDGIERLRLRTALPSTARLEIDFQAGFGDDWNAVPMPLRQGLVRLVAHAFSHRDGPDANALPTAVAALWQPYRELRL